MEEKKTGKRYYFVNGSGSKESGYDIFYNLEKNDDFAEKYRKYFEEAAKGTKGEPSKPADKRDETGSVTDGKAEQQTKGKKADKVVIAGLELPNNNLILSLLYGAVIFLIIFVSAICLYFLVGAHKVDKTGQTVPTEQTEGIDGEAATDGVEMPAAGQTGEE